MTWFAPVCVCRSRFVLIHFHFTLFSSAAFRWLFFDIILFLNGGEGEWALLCCRMRLFCSGFTECTLLYIIINFISRFLFLSDMRRTFTSLYGCSKVARVKSSSGALLQCFPRNAIRIIVIFMFDASYCCWCVAAFLILILARLHHILYTHAVCCFLFSFGCVLSSEIRSNTLFSNQRKTFFPFSSSSFSFSVSHSLSKLRQCVCVCVRVNACEPESEIHVWMFCFVDFRVLSSHSDVFIFKTHPTYKRSFCLWDCLVPRKVKISARQSHSHTNNALSKLMALIRIALARIFRNNRKIQWQQIVFLVYYF